MPTNKNALVRYKTIDKLLASRKGYTYEELAKACSEDLQKEGIPSVSVASIRKDVAAMKRIYGVQVEILGNRGHERPLAYSESSRTIKGETVTDPNLAELQEAFAILETVEGIAYVQPAIDSIKKKLNAKTGADTSTYISFAHPPKLKNAELVWKLYKNIYKHNPLTVTYQPVGKDAYTVEFQPYFLKCYNNRWFLLGWDYNRKNPKKPDDPPGGIVNLAVDRIVSYKVSHKPSSQLRRNDIDFKTYFDHVIGVTFFPNAELTKIRFRVHTSEKDGIRDLHRIETKPIHWTQTEIEKTPEYTDFTIEVYPNNELDAVLREFEHIEIIEPSFVRKEFVKRLRNIAIHYPELNSDTSDAISDK